MVNRVVVTLEQPEYSALLKVARVELRDPRDQLRYILRCELERRGLLPPVDHNSQGVTNERQT
ncbi:MAG: hypothetical protein DRI77_08315 [Chloroflexi bacterium]|nr:MAG: hypothetical protein DRI77_08315 [Chloroflexota bacterium]